MDEWWNLVESGGLLVDVQWNVVDEWWILVECGGFWWILMDSSG